MVGTALDKKIATGMYLTPEVYLMSLCVTVPGHCLHSSLTSYQSISICDIIAVRSVIAIIGP